MFKVRNHKGFSHHFLLPVLAVLAVGAIGYYMLNQSKADTPIPANATFKLFAPAWRGMGDSSNEANRKYFKEVFTNADPAVFKGLSEGTKVYKYTLGPYVTQAYVRCGLIPDTNAAKNSSQCGRPDKVLDDSAIAVQKDNHKLATYPDAFKNNFLLIPNASATLRYVESDAAKKLKKSGTGPVIYDGILSDSMGVAPLGSGYLITPPWKPGTSPSSTFSSSEWLEAQSKMLTAKKKGLETVGADKQLIINGLANGANYFKTPSAGKVFGANPDISGLMAERIFREPHAAMTSRESFDLWKKNVDMIADVQAKGKKGYWWSKCWTNKSPSGRQTCQDDANYSKEIVKLRRFVMGSYLLAAGDKSYFNFDTDICDGGPVKVGKKETCPKSNAAEWFDDYAKAMRLGKATGAYVQKTDTKLFTRNFEYGMVIVNPDTKDYELPLSGTFYNLNGKKVTGKAIAPAGTSMIYLRSK